MSDRVAADLIVTDEEAEFRKRGYSLGTTLGEGSYAKVKSAYSDRLQKRVAVKIINRKKAPKDFRDKFLPRELQVLGAVSHPNIVKMFEELEFHSKVYIVMEHAGHGDLLEYIKLRGAIPEDKSRVMFKQLMDAVDYLHLRFIVHRDLKCENLLLDGMNNLKVSDFGFARFFNPGDLSRTFCGSAAYAAPEILQGVPYNLPLHDIWSMGIILYIMVCASMPYDDSNIKKMVKLQIESKVGFSKSKKVSPECKDLIHRILEVNVKKRATMEDMRKHAWVNKDPPEKLQTASVNARNLSSSSRLLMNATPSDRKSPIQPQINLDGAKDKSDKAKESARDSIPVVQNNEKVVMADIPDEMTKFAA